MKFSIVTISYNQAPYLQSCIESVLNQSYTDYEYIIVDPGSTDGSREIVESYGDRVIKIFEKDLGPSDGLNKGFSYAKGDIFFYLNSDDILLPGSLESVRNYFLNGTDIVVGNAYIINEDSMIIRKAFSDKFTLKSYAYGACTIIQPSTFFTKKIFRCTNGFNIKNKSSWDGELLVDMIKSGASIRIVNYFYSCYRIHKFSITGSGRLLDDQKKHFENMFFKIYGKNFKFIDRLLIYFYRVRKHLFHPRALFERVTKGPIFGSKKN